MSRAITKQRGAVALITAMIVSVLLMITTAGMVSLTLKSLRGSTDGAQSTKAYYAAEGGLEEALRQIREGNIPNNCAGANAADSAQSGVVTCVKVTQNDNEVAGSLGANESVQIDLSAVAGLQIVKLEWTTPDGVAYDSASIPAYKMGTGESNFPPQGNSWPSTAPAVMELGVVEYPSAETFTIAQVKFLQGNVVPKSGKPGEPTSNFDASNGINSFNIHDQSDLSKPFVTTCSPGIDVVYQCSALARDLSSSNRYALRLKTRYNGAKYRITAIGASGQLTIPSSTYTIDVTARAGNLFRRIRTSFPIGNTSPTAAAGLDYVLYSDTEICKSFKVAGGAKELDSGISCLP